MTLISDDQDWIEAYLTENNLAHVETGDRVAVALLPLPILLRAALVALMWRLYLYMLTSDAAILTIVGAIIGMLVVPVLVPISPEVAQSVAGGLALNLVLAYGIAQLAFQMLPARHSVAPEPKPASSPDVARGLALKLVVAMGSILAVFLLFGITDILLLNMAATVALAMGARGGWDMGIGWVATNLI